MINVRINNVNVSVEEGTTILDAAREAGFNIPTLCFLRNVNESGACRVCLVEIKGGRNLVPACNYKCYDGLQVYTHSERAIAGRKNSVELILSNHSKNCLSCVRNQNCELQTLAADLGIRDVKFEGDKTPVTFDNLSNGLVRDTSKCILCGRCIETCKKVQGLGILGFENRGFMTKVGPVFDKSLSQVNCMQCGQCINACPTGALTEKEAIHDVLAALDDPEKHVIVQTAPAIRAALGEEFGMPMGSRVTGKMTTALKRMGFDKVYDTNFGADLTIMEEGYEFIDRFQKGGTLPMITSCSPGWVRYLEFQYPELIPHLSSCKSPHMMLGAIAKSYYAKNKYIDPKNIYVVSIMPCIAKKSEIVKPENNTGEYPDVDAVLTTRELARMIKTFGIDFAHLPDSEFDQDLMGEYTGAGAIFGNTGGVMEAAIRTVKEVLEGKSFQNVEYHEVRGLQGVKEASLAIAGTIVNVAVASGMANAKPLLDEIKEGKSKYHFIEIMGCPGGCINGGGQPIVKSYFKNFNGNEYIRLRARALYSEDTSRKIRKSHENPQIQALYKNFLEKPGSHLAHELLHTTYSAKDRFEIE